jgi:hypothetical protein
MSTTINTYSNNDHSRSHASYVWFMCGPHAFMNTHVCVYDQITFVFCIHGFGSLSVCRLRWFCCSQSANDLASPKPLIQAPCNTCIIAMWAGMNLCIGGQVASTLCLGLQNDIEETLGVLFAQLLTNMCNWIHAPRTTLAISALCAGPNYKSSKKRRSKMSTSEAYHVWVRPQLISITNNDCVNCYGVLYSDHHTNP